MYVVTFTYQEKDYTGYIASSTVKEPHFHWLFFTDPELTRLVGDDCVAFKDEDGKLVHFNHIPPKHAELVSIALKHVQEYLRAGSTKK